METSVQNMKRCERAKCKTRYQAISKSTKEVCLNHGNADDPFCIHLAEAQQTLLENVPTYLRLGHFYKARSSLCGVP